MPTLTFCIVDTVERSGSLERCVRSLLAQTVDDHEIVLVQSATAGHRNVVDDRRVRVLSGPASARGRLAAAVAVATGEFVMVVDPATVLDDGVTDCLRSLAARDPDLAAVYWDERLDVAGGRELVFKPEWSPERARQQNYIGSSVAFRTVRLRELGELGGTSTAEAVYEAILRVSLGPRTIRRVPLAAVVHDRRPLTDGGIDGRAQPLVAICTAATADAARRHLEARGIPATVRPSADGVRHVVIREATEESDDGRPLVSVVMPTVGTARRVWGDDGPLVVRAIRSLLTATLSPALEVVVVLDPRTPGTVREGLATMDVLAVEGSGPFNFAERCNAGVAASSGDHVLLLNDDTYIEDSSWLTNMLGFFAEDDVAVVGARLLYADATLQHAGILLNEQPLHIFRGYAADDPGPGGLLLVAREVSAVTGACLMTTRSLYDRLGGLDTTFAVAFNDLDYCLRARAAGYRVIWTPGATLYHFESQTRPPDAAEDEIELLYERWSAELHDDPYGNPGFEPRQAEWIERQPLSVEQRLLRALRHITSRHRKGRRPARGALG